MRIFLASLSAMLLAGGISGPTKIKLADGTETTEGILLAETILETHTRACWAHYVEQTEQRVTAQPVAQTIDVSSLSATGQAAYFQNQTIQLLAQQMMANNTMMVGMMKAVVQALRPNPCNQLENTMVAYYQSVGARAAAQSRVWQSGLSVAGIAGGILATGWAVGNVVGKANPGFSNSGGLSINASNSGSSGGVVGPDGIPIPGSAQNRVMNLSVGNGDRINQTNFASGQISGPTEKLIQTKDSPNIVPTLDDSGDGSGNEAGLLQ